MNTRVVVVGGGIAGVSTVAALRAGGFDGDLTLVDAGEFPYDRPPLSKDYLSGTTELKAIALQPPQWYDNQQVRLITGSTVSALRTDAGRLELNDGTTLPADRIVLATGGRAGRPPIPGIDSPRVHVLRTAEDADRLRAALQPGTRLLIVGAGLIGAEVASTARQLGCEVVLVDPLSPPLAMAFGSGVAAWLHHLHYTHGVTTVHGAVEGFHESRDAISVTLSGEEHTRSFDTVVLAVGMVADTALAEAAGLRVDRGIIVGPDNLTSNPAVLAVGDAARICVNGALAHRSEHWEAAQHDGQRAAATILGTTAPADTAPWFWTERHSVHVEVVGALNQADEIAVRGSIGQPPFSVFGLRAGRVIGAVSVDDSPAVRAARRLIDRGITVEGAQLTDRGSDLRKLVRR
jgi:3-phenylpropionate/trans-cinnamate dioxygenase ferredoxin reductase component